MTSFVHVDRPTQHPGVARAQRAYSAVHDLVTQFDGARGAASLLLAAAVAALLVVANQVVETWTEGHLLAAWIVLWTVAFAALALLAAPLRSAVRQVAAVAGRVRAARRQAREDRQLWDVALTDARVMAELSCAMTRDSARDVRGFI